MKLYKYISFKDGYWKPPLKENKLYFSTHKQLHEKNDAEEFTAEWYTHSNYLKSEAGNFAVVYESIFNNVRVLCLSRHLNFNLFSDFCGAEGGICLEFEFDSVNYTGDVMHGEVVYRDKKERNPLTYLISKASNPAVVAILNKTQPLNVSEGSELLSWYHTREPNKIFEDHIQNEITLKKLTKFSNEFEYRFVHNEEPITGQKLKCVLKNQTLIFSELSLKLIRILSSDTCHVKKEFPNLETPIEDFKGNCFSA